MPEDKIQAALKEISFCDELKVKIQDGVIIAICKQVIQRPKKAGVATQHTIDEEITK